MWLDVLSRSGGDAALNDILTRWSHNNPKPIVLLIDEVDSLVGDTLISVLRQICSGYDKRPSHFPQSIILCGVRDVRDHRIHSDKDKAVVTGGSAFNIKAESLQLGNFSREETGRLYAIHTEETGQPFTPDALNLAWEYTRGQPWLVNALGYETCFRMREGRDQTADYIDRCGSEEGHLIIFDRNPEKRWAEKIFRRNEIHDGKTITVWGM